MEYKTKSCTWGVSDLKWLDVRRSPSPQLQFTFTWLVETAEGKQFGVSIPGVRYIKKSDGTYAIRPPTQRTTAHATYYAAIFTLDLLNAIEAAFIAGGQQEKTGSYWKSEDLLKEPIVI